MHRAFDTIAHHICTLVIIKHSVRYTSHKIKNSHTHTQHQSGHLMMPLQLCFMLCTHTHFLSFNGIKFCLFGFSRIAPATHKYIQIYCRMILFLVKTNINYIMSAPTTVIALYGLCPRSQSVSQFLCSVYAILLFNGLY